MISSVPSVSAIDNIFPSVDTRLKHSLHTPEPTFVQGSSLASLKAMCCASIYQNLVSSSFGNWYFTFSSLSDSSLYRFSSFSASHRLFSMACLEVNPIQLCQTVRFEKFYHQPKRTLVPILTARWIFHLTDSESSLIIQPCWQGDGSIGFGTIWLSSIYTRGNLHVEYVMLERIGMAVTLLGRPFRF